MSPATQMNPSASGNLDGWHDVLRCPDCGGAVSRRETWSCASCGFLAPTIQNLKPVKPQRRVLEIDLQAVRDPEQALKAIDIGPPAIVYDGPAPGRSPYAVFSALAAHCPAGSRLLDLGCGPRDQAPPAAHLSYKYLGVDYSHPSADLLVDAHALPLATDSFDAVLSFAVFEHLYNPFLALREVARVLRPGGVFVGVVSQGEPFHESYFHHTSWALVSLADSCAELDLTRIWPSRDTLLSLGKMGRYSKPVKASLRLLDTFHRKTPFLTPRKMRAPARFRALDEVNRAGSLGFVMQRR